MFLKGGNAQFSKGTVIVNMHSLQVLSLKVKVMVCKSCERYNSTLVYSTIENHQL